MNKLNFIALAEHVVVFGKQRCFTIIFLKMPAGMEKDVDLVSIDS